jgi:GDSL-like Lipase/Acylhydrolase family
MSRGQSVLFVLGLVLPLVAEPDKVGERFAKWEKEVSAIEKRQAEKPPTKGGIVFAGSSTIRLWDVAKSFPDWKATNSGLGGSEIRDVTHFADRLIFKHEPRVIVFYAGDNDINFGRSPEKVLEDFQRFVEAAHKAVPKTEIYIVSIKPSPARWSQYEKQTKANALVKEFCAKDKRLTYVNVVRDLLTDEKPNEEFYGKDRLHLSPKGYEVLTDVVRRAVK